MVRLIRAEDIPVEDQSLSTYVDVYLLPQDLQSETFQPNEATINVSFRFVLLREFIVIALCLHDSSDFVD